MPRTARRPDDDEAFDIRQRTAFGSILSIARSTDSPYDEAVRFIARSLWSLIDRI